MVRKTPRLDLRQLYNLKNGWLDGAGHGPDWRDVAWFDVTWSLRWRIDLPAPYVYPTEGGGLSLEWSLPGYEIGLEVDLLARTGELLCVPLGPGASATCLALDFCTDEAWKELFARVQHSASADPLKLT